MPPDFKPAPRYVADQEEWEYLRQAKRGRCRGCPPSEKRNRRTTLHHLVPKSLGGDDVEDNLIPLCGTGTTGCHGIIETHPPGWEATAGRVRASLSKYELRYAVNKKSEVWLDRYLPKE